MVNKKIAIIVGAVVLVISAVVSYFMFSGQSSFMANPTSSYKPPTASGSTTAQNNEPKTEECPINGALLTKTQKSLWEKRRPMGVMMENHKEARPQSGFSNADVIYEAVAEGGITRMLSVFYCQDAPMIGPIRSARIYFLKFLQGYGDHPLYAHVGGANAAGPADALGEISDLGWNNYNDLNQFAVPFPYYWRDYDRLPGSATEHTVYSTTSKLWDFAAKKRGLTNINEKGQKWDVGFVPWKFRDEVKLEDRGSATKIDFSFWTQFASDYNVTWNYDKISNTYLRVNGGQPHIDKNTDKQLSTKNVIIVFADESAVNDEHGSDHLFYKIIGTGEGLVFQDGKSTKMTWRKKDEETNMKFYDASGKEISIVRGQVWVEVLPIGNKVIY